MSKILNLEELAKQKINVEEYGLKVKGLIDLQIALKDFKQTGDVPIKIPDFFAVPVAEDFSSSELKNAYLFLWIMKLR